MEYCRAAVGDVRLIESEPSLASTQTIYQYSLRAENLNLPEYGQDSLAGFDVHFAKETQLVLPPL